MAKYVQYGCGDVAPDGWLSFDASPTLKWERIPVLGKLYTKNSERFPENVLFGNILKKLPVEDNSCDGVYSSHVLEHMSLEDCRKALRHSYQLLKPGGLFRVVVPDLKTMAEIYLNSDKKDAAKIFVEQTQMGREKRPSGMTSRIIETFGYTPHLWMWDDASLQLELENTGFHNVKVLSHLETDDPMFKLVEREDRCDGAIVLECQKPITTDLH